MHEWRKPRRSTQIDRHLIRIDYKTYPGESSRHTHAAVSAFTLHVCVIRFANGQRHLYKAWARVRDHPDQPPSNDTAITRCVEFNPPGEKNNVNESKG